jgi:hypothetical protein
MNTFYIFASKIITNKWINMTSTKVQIIEEKLREAKRHLSNLEDSIKTEEDILRSSELARIEIVWQKFEKAIGEGTLISTHFG